MYPKIALGMGDNVDYEIVWDSAPLEELIVEFDVINVELDLRTEVCSERDLVVSILSFLKAGVGGERRVASPRIIESFAQRFTFKPTLGGTSVRAAIAMRKLGHRSSLHLTTTNDYVRALIPADSPYVSSNTQDTLYPHLIIQFGEGAHVAASDIDITATRPNRIIYNNNPDSQTMRINLAWGEMIAEARVFLISGFNAMHDRVLLAERMKTLRQLLDFLPKDAHVYYEDAGFHQPGFSELVIQSLIDRITIYSLNEDELQAHVSRSLDLLDAHAIGEALTELHRQIPAPLVVVHSAYWALAWGAQARAYRTALKGGVAMATTRFRHGDDFTPEHYHQIEATAPNPQGAAFASAIEALLGEMVCCVPVAQVEQHNATTIGLGDAFVGGFLPLLV